MRPELKNRLTFRLGLSLCLATGVIMVAIGGWNLRLQRSHLLRLVELSATERADVIRGSTREAMMRNNPDEVRRIIEAIAQQDTVDRIRIFDKKGEILTSTDPGEIGALVDTTAEQCIFCHQPDQTLESLDQEQRARTFVRSDGSRVLGVIAPIRNEPACANTSCHAHPPNQKILGVLDVQLSLRGVDEALAVSEAQMLFGLVGTAVAVLLLAWLLTWRLVLKPVARLKEAAVKAAGGDLSTRMIVDSKDEIGDLTRAWNLMNEQLESAYSELKGWGRTLEDKVEYKTRELERAHQRMLLVEKMASLGRMAAVVAHEVNNPLTGISTYARLLRKKLSQSPAQETASAESTDRETARVLMLIESEAIRCGEIVRDLLLFSKTPAARFSQEQLQPLVKRCLLLLDHQARAQDIQILQDIPADLPAISCDASQLQQLLLALTINALEATPAGGSVSISATTAEKDEQIILRVADTGSGIAPEHLDKIFEPFFTTKQDTEGVGLGLAVVYGIVKRHQGSVVVDSSPAAGTTFTVRLPIRRSADSPEPEGSFEEAPGR